MVILCVVYMFSQLYHAIWNPTICLAISIINYMLWATSYRHLIYIYMYIAIGCDDENHREHKNTNKPKTLPRAEQNRKNQKPRRSEQRVTKTGPIVAQIFAWFSQWFHSIPEQQLWFVWFRWLSKWLCSIHIRCNRLHVWSLCPDPPPSPHPIPPHALVFLLVLVRVGLLTLPWIRRATLPVTIEATGGGNSFGFTLDSLGLILDSLGLIWIHLDPFGFICIHLDSFCFIWNHMDWFGSIWIHLDTLGFTWTHLDSVGLTWSNLVSFGPIWIQLESFRFIWIHLDSLEFNWITCNRLDSFGFTWIQ